MDILESKFTKIEEKANNHLVPSRKKLRRRADEINKDFMVTRISFSAPRKDVVRLMDLKYL